MEGGEGGGGGGGQDFLVKMGVSHTGRLSIEGRGALLPNNDTWILWQ